MPRQPRLDAPGLLQHVMARGIERRKLFRDDKDRACYVERLALILEETHFEIAKVILNQEKHVLVEKPLTLKAKEARLLKELAEEKGVNLMGVALLHFRYNNCCGCYPVHSSDESLLDYFKMTGALSM